MTAHWGIADPASVEGTDLDKERAFIEAFRFMRNRIQAFISLPITAIDKMALKQELSTIGLMEGATK
jgi:arsenate reductase